MANPITNLRTDTAHEIVALAEAVGLKGFDREQKSPSKPVAAMPADTADDIVALAKAVGSKGFAQ